MFQFDKLRIQITARPNDSEELSKFGCCLDFKKGLNIIAGDNTSGKTTVAKCLYYILGLEELIDGKRGIEILDKSVKDTFSVKLEGDEKEKSCHVIKSSVFAQLTNEDGTVITLMRQIKSDGVVRTNIIKVWDIPMSNAIKQQQPTEYYIHAIDDNNPDYPSGFYAFLAQFAGLPIIMVPSRIKAGASQLYMQCVFALSFIEQTRGWSDFFATIRSMNIYFPKQRIIEYALGLDADSKYETLKSLKTQSDEIQHSWKEKVRTFKSLLTYNNLYANRIENEVKKQEVECDELLIGLIGRRDTLDTYIASLAQRITELQNQKQDDRHTDDQMYQTKLKEAQQMQQEYLNFSIQLNMDKQKFTSINAQIEKLEEEKRMSNSLKRVNNLVYANQIKVCPTCNQPLLNIENHIEAFSVPEEEYEQSIDEKNTQIKFLQTMSKSLRDTIEQKEIYLMYYQKLLNQKKEELKIVEESMGTPINSPSEVLLYELADCRFKKAQYERVQQQLVVFKKELSLIKQAYVVVTGKVKDLKKQAVETSNANINTLLTNFKQLLSEFNYKSNYPNHIFLDQDNNSSYRYLPVIENEGIEESIRSSSSASDFIRSLWAYYLTLMKMGKHHPGILVMDEPCQHSVKEASLKALFKACADCHDKQILLFCSTQPRTEEYVNAPKDGHLKTKKEDSNVIGDILKGLKRTDINFISVDPKSIKIFNK